MDGRLEWVVGPDGGASSEQPWLVAAPMLTETVVEQVVQARARGEAVAAVARAYGLDHESVTLSTLAKAAQVVGRRLRLELV